MIKALKIGAWVGSMIFAILVVLVVLGFQTEYESYWEEATAERERYERVEAFLLREIGSEEINLLREWDEAAFWERHRTGEAEENPQVLINGFEAFGFTAQMLQELWSDTTGNYPKGWIAGEVREVRYVDEVPNTGIPDTDAIASAFERDEIHFYQKALSYAGEDARSAIDILATTFEHELAHHNDWFYDREMSLADRAELLINVLNRMQSDKPFQNPDLDSMMQGHYQATGSGDPAEAEGEDDYLFSSEYWAYVSEEYFRAPERLKRDWPEDYALVDSQIRKSDPDFDPIAARDARVAIMEGIIDKALIREAL